MELLPRSLFSDDHNLFREQVRRFVAKEIVPFHAEWESAHQVPKEVWRRAGRQGYLCCWVKEQDGGPGGDLLHDIIVCEELGRVGATGPGFPLHSMIVAPYIAEYGVPALKKAILPAMVSGDRVGAIVLTEPHAGSDLVAIRTRAVKDGDEWIITGQKTFITNGHNCDVMVVACKTDPDKGAKGISLFTVESSMAGFSRGRNLRKIGQAAQDTAELFFDNVRVPADHLLGDVNKGFAYLMSQLVQERLILSVQCQARAEAAFLWTVDYVKDRKAFGQRIADFQNTRFKLAELKAHLQAGRAFCDRLVELHLEGRLDAATVSAGKLWHSEMLARVTDECLQLHGGYGYMMDFPIAKAYVDARIERIYAGTSEIMKEVIARSICD
jgi:acyl-CoA dehydrogenase